MKRLSQKELKTLIEQRMLRSVLGDITVVIGIAISLLIYLFGSAQGVQGMDAGEFMTVAGEGGRLHPPGYPISMYLMQLAQILPFGTVAWKASSVSAVFGALTVGVCSAMFFRITHSRLVAISLSLTFAVQPLWLRYFTISEVFAPAAFATACLTWLAVEVQFGMKGRRVMVLLGIISGFAAANHHGYIFAGPLVLWIMWAAKLGWKGSLGSVAIGSLGLLIYLPLMGADGPWVWGNWDNLEGLVHHVLRSDYGTLSLRAGDMGAHWWSHPLKYLSILPLDLFVLPCGLAVFGLWRGSRHGLTWFLLLTWLTSGVFFFALFNIPTTGEAAVIAERFMVPISVFLVPIIAMGIVGYESKAIWKVILVALPIGAASIHLGRVEHGYDNRLETYIRNTCSVLPKDSLFVIEGDGMVFGMLYAQEILGICSDVLVISPAMLSYPWYQDHLRLQDPTLFDESISIDALIEKNLPKRNIYTNFSFLGSAERTSRFPPAIPMAFGMRFLKDGEVFPFPQEVESELMNQFRQFEWASTPIHPFLTNRTAEVWATHQYAHAWDALRNAYLVRGDDDSALRALTMAEILRRGDWIISE